MSRSFQALYFIFTLLGQLLGGLICGIAILPSFLLVAYAWNSFSAYPERLSRIVLVCFSLGVGYFIFAIVLLAVIIAVRHLFRLSNREGRAEIFSANTLMNATFNYLLSIANHFSLPLVRSTPIIIMFYRGMGA